MTLEETNKRIEEEFDRLKKILLEKNTIYGNSLHNPIGVFQKNKMEGLLGRIDDKLNRIRTVGLNADTEDTIDDLIGYQIHLLIMNKELKNDIKN